MDKKTEENLPIKSLHDFQSELDHEWGKFKSASIVSILLACFILVFAAYRIIRSAALAFEPEYLIVFPFAIALLAYGIWIMSAQLRFLKKWERRMRDLVSLEEQLMNEKLENASK